MRKTISFSTRGVLGLVCISAFALACAGRPGPSDMPESSILADAPDWVLQSCSAYWGDNDARICGVGSAGGTKNISLARNAAIGRARTEIARSLQLKVKSMLKDYQATTTGGEEYGTHAADEQHIVDVSKQLTDIDLVGVEQQDMWISPSGQVYVLMVYDAEKFSMAVSGMKNLSDQIRTAVIERADESFRELDEELERD